MPQEKMFAGFDAETRTPSAQGGRPTKLSGAMIPEFVSENVLKIYVSYLRARAPRSWSTRQVNHHLFGEPGKPLSKTTPVTNGLGHLLTRKSIPQLVSGQLASVGILRAENDPRFAGGLQILYHPYVQALAGKHALPVLHTLLCLMPWAHIAGLFQASAHGSVRALRSVETEIEIVTAASQGWRDPSSWQYRFPDAIGCALLLTQEAAAIGDIRRLRRWQRWFRRRELLFENWPVGETDPRKALDRWVELSVENLYIESVDPWTSGFEYLANHVLAVGPSKAATGKNQEQEVNAPTFTLGELSGLLKAIQNGHQGPRQ